MRQTPYGLVIAEGDHVAVQVFVTGTTADGKRLNNKTGLHEDTAYIMKHWGDEVGPGTELVEHIDDMLAAHRAYLLGWNVGSADESNLVTYRSDVPHATLNGVLRVRGSTPAAALTEARERLDGVPRIWWVGPDSDAGTADGLVALGATPFASLPIMATEVDRVVPLPPPADLHIAETTDLDEFVPAYGRVSGIRAEGLPAAIAREKAFAGDGTVVRLAGRFQDGPVVGTAVAWLSHGLLTLYFVGTQPEQRGRGVGTAMTLAAVAVARRHGVATVALTSSPVGEPLYARLGFRTVGRFQILSF